ncbi:hypothetical protein SAMN02745121_04352 [Nannocystis exedens]|uniref:HmuY protein n=1 Tax=Nannocystis exedens TaxID=54 RepID=A0A1I2ASF8_9BACT|nr:hypothetical protein [Nannocystis exedens]PCC74249.1 hypothetical protein NAEX_07338 [Nannocystis exedens]SFE46924.1 hypothetical protein SAMN02745121_04352 [Nannocystis exedens]
MQTNLNIHLGALLGAVLVLGASACDDAESNETALDGAAAEDGDVETLAEIELEGAAIRFTRAANGAVVVAEEGPFDKPSYIGYFAVEFEATPLEMFLALEPDGDAPEELVLQHAAQTSERPRQLSAPNFSFRSVSQTEYGTSCAQADDGAWFDNEWTTRGWTWHWYYSGSTSNTSTPTKTTSNFITHLCNYSVTPNALYSLSHYLYDQTSGTVLIADNDFVNVGNRSVFYVTSQSGQYRAQAAFGSGASGSYRLGGMAP